MDHVSFVIYNQIPYCHIISESLVNCVRGGRVTSFPEPTPNPWVGYSLVGYPNSVGEVYTYQDHSFKKETLPTLDGRSV